MENTAAKITLLAFVVSHMETTIGDITIFTKILDGKSILKCSCEYLWRAYFPGTELCPNCGRSTEHSTLTTVEEYKESRKTKEK